MTWDQHSHAVNTVNALKQAVPDGRKEGQSMGHTAADNGDHPQELGSRTLKEDIQRWQKCLDLPRRSGMDLAPKGQATEVKGDWNQNGEPEPSTTQSVELLLKNNQ